MIGQWKRNIFVPIQAIQLSIVKKIAAAKNMHECIENARERNILLLF